jgi:hypothetical protein
MTQGLALAASTMAFLLAGYVSISVNSLPRFSVSPAVHEELTTLLRINGMNPLPLGDPPGNIIDTALRFRAPDCPHDSFLLPLPDTLLTDVQGVRFSELTGVAYRSTKLSRNSEADILRARVSSALAALQHAFGEKAARNDHTVLAQFTPTDCPATRLDMRAFWTSRPG